MYTDFDYEALVRMSAAGGDNSVLLTNNAEGNRWSVRGLVTSPISLPMSADYSDSKGSEAMATFNTFMGNLIAFGNKTGAISQGQVRAQNLSGSMRSWADSSRFQLNLDVVFVKISEEDKILDKLKVLYDGVVPSFDSGQGGSNVNNFIPSIITAPGGYSVGNAANPTGVISIQIGRWFKLVNKLVMTRYSPTFSKEVTASGAPLYCVASISLESYRLLSVEEMKAGFITS